MEDTIKLVDEINDKLEKLYETKINNSFERNIELEALNRIDFIIDKYTKMRKIICGGFKNEESFNQFNVLQIELHKSNKADNLENLISSYFYLKRISEFEKINN